jgi:hypothetical protein
VCFQDNATVNTGRGGRNTLSRDSLRPHSPCCRAAAGVMNPTPDPLRRPRVSTPLVLRAKILGTKHKSCQRSVVCPRAQSGSRQRARPCPPLPPCEASGRHSRCRRRPVASNGIHQPSNSDIVRGSSASLAANRTRPTTPTFSVLVIRGLTSGQTHRPHFTVPNPFEFQQSAVGRFKVEQGKADRRAGTMSGTRTATAAKLEVIHESPSLCILSNDFMDRGASCLAVTYPSHIQGSTSVGDFSILAHRFWSSFLTSIGGVRTNAREQSLMHMAGAAREPCKSTVRMLPSTCWSTMASKIEQFPGWNMFAYKRR